MSQRLPLIAFLVGLLAGDVTYRLTEFATYQALLLAALAVAGLLYALGGMHELVRDAAFPLAGGFVASGAIKWLFASMQS